MGMSILGGGVGALVLMPFTDGKGEDCFMASWVGIGGTILSFILIKTIIVEPKKKNKEEEEDKDKPKKATVTKLSSKILWMALFASALDAAGDEGTRIARGTVL